MPHPITLGCLLQPHQVVVVRGRINISLEQKIPLHKPAALHGDVSSSVGVLIPVNSEGNVKAVVRERADVDPVAHRAAGVVR